MQKQIIEEYLRKLLRKHQIDNESLIADLIKYIMMVNHSGYCDGAR
jgi:hypothetical protein